MTDFTFNMKNKVNYRKNIVRELHNLKHRKKYLYQTIYHPTKRRYPEDYSWIDILQKEYEITNAKIELLEKILHD